MKDAGKEEMISNQEAFQRDGISLGPSSAHMMGSKARPDHLSKWGGKVGKACSGDSLCDSPWLEQRVSEAEKAEAARGLGWEGW